MPAGGALIFNGYKPNGRPDITIHFGPNPEAMRYWQFWEPPWRILEEYPWTTSKR